MSSSVVTEMRNVVAFAELAVGDQLVVQTGRSTYSFTMTDPSQRLGELSGGGIVASKSAFAIGAVSAAHAFWKGGLRVGDRAVFLSPTSQDHDTSARIVTSTVLEISILWRQTRAA